MRSPAVSTSSIPTNTTRRRWEDDGEGMHHFFFGVGDACWIPAKVDSDAYLNVVKDYVWQWRDSYRMVKVTFTF
jgi:hypothetical protein